jgi:Tol biopolymer transport system component/DNA-binding winged helix-turn-helix (wHTH) protein
MHRQFNHFYDFGNFRLDATERVLLRDGKDLLLAPKTFDVLLALVQNSGRILEKEELMQLVWQDTFVEEVNLARNISDLRKILGDTRSSPQFIETIPKRGYRFVANVRQAFNNENLSETQSSNVLPFATPANTQDLVNPTESQTITHTSGNLLLAPVIEKSSKPPESETVEPSPLHIAPMTPIQDLDVRASSSTTHRKNPRRYVWAGIFILAVVAAVAIGFFAFSKKQEPPRPFRDMKITRLTQSSKISNAIISPDGKYVACILEEKDGKSIWMRQVATSSAVRILEPAQADFWGLTFSPDANYLYYVLFESKSAEPMLHEIPLLGGVPKRLPIVTTSPIGFSPDGNRIAYTVSSSSSGGTVLFTANPDGSDKTALTVAKDPDFFIDKLAPAWSPDGRMIVCSLAKSDVDGVHCNLVGVEIDSGQMRPLTSQKWLYVGQAAWRAGGDELVFIGVEPNSSLDQIWRLTLKTGEINRVTNDLNENRGVSLTADGKALLTVQTQTACSFWISSAQGSALKIPFDAGNVSQMALTPDDRIVYRSNLARNESLNLVDLQGASLKQFPFDAKGSSGIAVSPDGKYIVFSSHRTGRLNLWRVDMDGNNLVQLTNGDGEVRPLCTPDGKSVIYQKGFGNTLNTFWQLPIEGGEAIQLTQTHMKTPSLSPDGTLLAYYFMDTSLQPSAWRLGVMSMVSNAQLYKFDLPVNFSSQTLRWTPDGKALAYISEVGNVSNIWIQPLDGNPTKQLTNFLTDYTTDFAWTKSNQQLICLRMVETSYVALIQEF